MWFAEGCKLSVSTPDGREIRVGEDGWIGEATPNNRYVVEVAIPPTTCDLYRVVELAGIASFTGVELRRVRIDSSEIAHIPYHVEVLEGSGGGWIPPRKAGMGVVRLSDEGHTRCYLAGLAVQRQQIYLKVASKYDFHCWHKPDQPNVIVPSWIPSSLKVLLRNHYKYSLGYLIPYLPDPKPRPLPTDPRQGIITMWNPLSGQGAINTAEGHNLSFSQEVIEHSSNSGYVGFCYGDRVEFEAEDGPYSQELERPIRHITRIRPWGITLP